MRRRAGLEPAIHRIALLVFLEPLEHDHPLCGGLSDRLASLGASPWSRAQALFAFWDPDMGEEQVQPGLTYERRLWDAGYCQVAGLDEAGRGSWAGPVVAAAVILPSDRPQLAEFLAGVRDSKGLSPARREVLLGAIKQHALAWGVGVVPAPEIDAHGIVPATRQAMYLALAALSLPADHLLIDYLSLPDQPLPQLSLTRGDALVLSIAAASIVAKVSRDRMMVDFDAQFPGYGFGQHKGYGTPQHRAALASLGPCSIHRLSFAPLQELAAEEGD